MVMHRAFENGLSKEKAHQMAGFLVFSEVSKT